MTKKILIVEDESDAAQALSEMLEKAGFATQVVEGATEAIRVVDVCQPDLLLVDIGLPDGNGLALANMLTDVRRIPAIIMTGMPSFQIGQPMGPNSCIKAVLIKPCSSRTLIQAILETFRGTSAVAS